MSVLAVKLSSLKLLRRTNYLLIQSGTTNRDRLHVVLKSLSFNPLLIPFMLEGRGVWFNRQTGEECSPPVGWQDNLLYLEWKYEFRKRETVRGIDGEISGRYESVSDALGVG